MADDAPAPGPFLPPQPSGPEPDLGRRPEPPPAPPGPEPAPQGYAPPAQAQAPPQQWAPAPAPAGADNGPAVLGFCLSLSSLGLLLVSGGLSTLVSVGLSIPGMLQSRKGTRRVREGLTTRNAGLATAGWVMGIVGLVLSVLATIFWVVILILVATNDEVRDEFERELDREFDQSSLSVLLLAARVAGAALL